jgi:GDPmannose 4,6-dehydratase
MTTTKTALITGITGQDGSYLADLLLEKGYVVHGLVRPVSTSNTARIDHLRRDRDVHDVRLFLHQADLSDSAQLARLLGRIEPHEIYNLAAQSHVPTSFEMPAYTADITGLGAVRLLEVLHETGLPARFYQAGSSEMFGKVREIPQRETTPFYPRSPYAAAKAYAHWMAVNYREAYQLFICNGILFNHESPRRGDCFVTRKITSAVAGIKAGLQDKLCLGNLTAARDWGYAKEYVEAMWLMLQQDQPDDYVIATGEAHSVRDFVIAAFSHAGLDWRPSVDTDHRHYRPTEVDFLVGDAEKAKSKLGWVPKTSFKELVHLMVDADIARVNRHRGD